MARMVSQEEYQRLVRLTEDLCAQNMAQNGGGTLSPQDLADVLVRQILSSADQSAKQLRRGRQAEGIARAKAQGVYAAGFPRCCGGLAAKGPDIPASAG